MAAHIIFDATDSDDELIGRIVAVAAMIFHRRHGDTSVEYHECMQSLGRAILAHAGEDLERVAERSWA